MVRVDVDEALVHEIQPEPRSPSTITGIGRIPSKLKGSMLSIIACTVQLPFMQVIFILYIV